jgi:hypothetical protein
MHTTLLDKNDHKKKKKHANRIMQELLQNFLAQYALLLVMVTFGVYED